MYKPANMIKLIMKNGRELLVPTDKSVQEVEQEVKDYNVLVFGKQVIQCEEVDKVDLLTKSQQV